MLVIGGVGVGGGAGAGVQALRISPAANINANAPIPRILMDITTFQFTLVASETVVRELMKVCQGRSYQGKVSSQNLSQDRQSRLGYAGSEFPEISTYCRRQSLGAGGRPRLLVLSKSVWREVFRCDECLDAHIFGKVLPGEGFSVW